MCLCIFCCDSYGTTPAVHSDALDATPNFRPIRGYPITELARPVWITGTNSGKYRGHARHPGNPRAIPAPAGRPLTPASTIPALGCPGAECPKFDLYAVLAGNSSPTTTRAAVHAALRGIWPTTSKKTTDLPGIPNRPAVTRAPTHEGEHLFCHGSSNRFNLCS